MDENERLAFKINSMKTRWANLAKEIQGICREGRNAKTDASKVISFKGMYRFMERNCDKFEELHDELALLHAEARKTTEFPSAEHEKTREAVRSYLYESSGIYEELVAKEKVTHISNLGTHPSFNASGSEARSSNLPKINLAKFEGDLLSWPQFRDTYEAIVHNDPTLTDIQKFHYLVSFLGGNAAVVIKTYQLTAANYAPAWKALSDTFNNKRLLASAYLNQLLDFSPLQGKTTVDGLKLFSNKISEAVESFKLLKIPSEADFILFHLAIKRLDPDTRKDFEVAHRATEFPTFHTLSGFVRDRFVAMQLAEGVNLHLDEKGGKYQSRDKPPPSFHRSRTSLMANEASKTEYTQQNTHNAASSSSSRPPCVACGEKHKLPDCSAFANASSQQRHQMLQSWQGCFNCLLPNHPTRLCKSKWHCRYCTIRHHSLLHINESSSASPSDGPTSAMMSSEPLEDKIPVQSLELSASFNCCANQSSSNSTVILGTAIAELQDIHGQFHRIRLVMDSGSQCSFITRRCAHRLGLPIQRTSRHISGIGGTALEGSKGLVRCVLKPYGIDSPILTSHAVVIDKITSHLPATELPQSIWSHLREFNLADQQFWKPGPIDFLVGCDLYPEIMTGEIFRINETLPAIFSSIFGKIVMGPVYPDYQLVTPIKSFFSFNETEPDLRSELKRFWECEEPSISSIPMDPDDTACEEHFKRTHYRLPTGQYVVRLPFKTQARPEFGDTSHIAIKRFTNLEAKLDRNPPLKEKYSDFMQEYINLGHMSQASTNSKYIIPHHSVTKEDRAIVKLRVVFNASSTTKFGSLNDHLMTGPKLQSNLRTILLVIRIHKILMVTDVVKMYRAILIDPSDRIYQHIVWRPNPQDALTVYELNTVTYGLTPAPFMALRTFHQLVKDEGAKFPSAAQVVKRDRYIDDFAFGADTITEALDLQSEVIQLLARGCFTLSKWASNCEEVLQAVQPQDKSTAPVTLESSEDFVIKVLGLQWDPVTDCFSYKLQLPEIKYTKRAILSTIARIFDPLGFISPVILNAKVLMQHLWKENLTWDEEISSSLKFLWKKIFNDLPSITNIKIPRFILSSDSFQYQLVGFCDASDKGLCCAIYLRISHRYQCSVHLLIAKTKVAPTNTISIPKLELCSALLLAKTFQSLDEFLARLPSSSTAAQFFTDSTIALAWIKTPPYKLKVFVANRVTMINQATPTDSWHHIRSGDNPSDCGSRGLAPSALLSHPLWWHGPPWLTKSMDNWPVTQISNIEESNLPELKPNQVTLGVINTSNDIVDWMKRISTFDKLIRIVALVRRFIDSWLMKYLPTSRKYRSRRTGPLRVSELQTSKECLIKVVQKFYFFKDDMATAPTVLQSQFMNLSPFFDNHNILRVGGRLKLSNLPISQKHTILIPNSSHLANLIVDHFHRMYLHPGPGLLQALVQLQYWIPSLRSLVKKRDFLCVKCYKLKSSPDNPYMADLPANRFAPGRAFINVGVDFAGAFYIRESLRRKAQVGKAYLCLFVCLSTKALHLEAVSSLSTEAFMACFDRFVSRRGLPTKILSDCGTNFVGASNSLRGVQKWLSSQEVQSEIISSLTNRNVEWIFNPPYAPHFGGIWEAGVKSAKMLFTRVVGEIPLTFEELHTLFAKIEAILNSRPLCPLSASPNDMDFLTPGHFLIGDNLLALPEDNLLQLCDNRLSRWQLVHKMQQNFWKRWHQEYLCYLNQRKKWTKPSPQLSVGDLVILKSDNLPVMSWPVARISDLHPSQDGITRVITVRTAKGGFFTRPVGKVVPLWPLKTEAFEC